MVSTFLTLIYVPVFYDLFDNMKTSAVRVVGGMFHHTTPKEENAHE